MARDIAALIRSRQAAKRTAVLGLATGSTPLGLYAELVRMHREEGLSFANVVTFNLDEYYPIQPSNPRSYRHFMQAHLFDHVDIPPANTHVPDGTAPASAVDAQCRDYEESIRAAGGIDFQILGIGRTGHIGFNEPGSPRRSRTRMVTLDSLTRRDAAGDFGGEENTPRHAITMGVRTILEARRVVLMAWGQHKAEIVRAAAEGPVTPQVTASFLQEHDNVHFVIDRAAAGALTRYRTPWLLGALGDQGLEWDPGMVRRAIIWLSQLQEEGRPQADRRRLQRGGAPGPPSDPGLGLRRQPRGLLPAAAHDHRLAGRPRPEAHEAGRRTRAPAARPIRGSLPQADPRPFARIRTTTSSGWAARSAAWSSMATRSMSPTRSPAPMRSRTRLSPARCASWATPAWPRPRTRSA